MERGLTKSLQKYVGPGCKFVAYHMFGVKRSKNKVAVIMFRFVSFIFVHLCID